MFFTYILESEIDGSFYIGQTKSLKSRILKHNKGYNKSTKANRPRKLKFSKEFETRSDAYKAEQYLKKLKSREAVLGWIEKNRGVAQSG